MPSPKKQRLGRGLEGLLQSKLGSNPKEMVTEKEAELLTAKDGVLKTVPINKVERNKEQPRYRFNEESLAELAESIKQQGILTPILVKDRGDHFQIIAGERRWRAAMAAGLTEVPVIIRDLSEQQIAEIALIENLQREDLDPIEEALGYKSLKDKYSLTDEQVAEKVSKSRTAVTNSLRLLKLDERVREMVIDKKLTTGHVRPLLTIEETDTQYKLAQTSYEQKLSVRQVEQLVKTFKTPPKPKVKKDLEKYQVHYDEFAGKLAEKLGTKVSAPLNDKEKGKIEIEFYSSDEFEKFFELLMR